MLQSRQFMLASVALVFGTSVHADDPSIVLGRPKLWPFSEGRSLVRSSRTALRGLSLSYPEKLDPNQIHYHELDVLRSSLGIRVEIDQEALKKNQLAQDAYDRDLKAAEQARAQLANIQGKTRELEKARLEAIRAAKELAPLQKMLLSRVAEVDTALGKLPTNPGNANSGDATNASTRNTPESSATGDRSASNADLTGDRGDAIAVGEGATAVRRQQLEDERKKLLDERHIIDRKVAESEGRAGAIQEEITSLKAEEADLKTKATMPSAPTLVSTGGTSPEVNSTSAWWTNSDADLKGILKDKIKKIIDEDPKQHLQHLLDNLTDGELQLISRKLTLAQEVVGENYRLHFMELSGSIAPMRQHKRKTARMRWTVTCEDGCLASGTPRTDTAKTDTLSKLEPYVYEMTPVQSKTLTATGTVRERRFALQVLGKSLIGFGGGADYHRSRNQYGQSLSRQLFMAGFGKGSTKFGWDVLPSFGEPFVADGVYTAYAILAVPRLAKKLKFTTEHVWVDQAGKRVPGVGGEKGDEYYIPLDGEGFYVNRIQYQQTISGQPFTLLLGGTQFSEETSIFVNGYALRPRNSKPPSDQNQATRAEGSVDGEFEVVSPEAIIATFRLKEPKSIPTIMLISPGKSGLLNDYEVRLNDRVRVRLSDIQREYDLGQSSPEYFFAPDKDFVGVIEGGVSWEGKNVSLRVSNLSNQKYEGTVTINDGEQGGDKPKTYKIATPPTSSQPPNGEFVTNLSWTEERLEFSLPSNEAVQSIRVLFTPRIGTATGTKQATFSRDVPAHTYKGKFRN
jgi:hypothetical protein